VGGPRGGGQRGGGGGGGGTGRRPATAAAAAGRTAAPVKAVGVSAKAVEAAMVMVGGGWGRAKGRRE